MFNQKKTIKSTESVVNSTNIIGRGTTIQGDIEAQGNLRIEGKLIGNLSTQSKLVLAPGAYLKGNILAKDVEIGGTMEGKIEARDTLTIRAQANIKGTLHTKQLIVEVGAQFNGQCHMKDPEPQISHSLKKKEPLAKAISPAVSN